jgi:hypothetical protein
MSAVEDWAFVGVVEKETLLACRLVRAVPAVGRVHCGAHA